MSDNERHTPRPNDDVFNTHPDLTDLDIHLDFYKVGYCDARFIGVTVPQRYKDPTESAGYMTGWKSGLDDKAYPL